MTFYTPPRILDGHRWRGLRVGLLGGSFNPPHQGHLHISEVALKALQLDCVWWLVTPQNPLKDNRDTLPFEERMELCRGITAHNPRILVSDLENLFNSVRTLQTVQNLRIMFPFTGFVFLAGSDVVAQLPRWYRWQDIPGQIAMGFVARPPAPSFARHNPLQALARENHHLLAESKKLPLNPGNCFWIAGHRLDDASSTKLRNSNKNSNLN